MQRQLYLALLLATMALAAAVCLRPSLGDDLIRLTGLQSGTAPQYGGTTGFSGGGSAYPVGTSSPPQPLAPAGQSVPWPAIPVGQTPAVPWQDDPRLTSAPYQTAAQPQNPSWPATPYWPQAAPPGAEGPRSAEYWGAEGATGLSPGPSYPVAGAGRSGPGPLPPGPLSSDPPASEPLTSGPLTVGPSALPVAPGPPQATPCEGTEALARVGNEVILASEVMPAFQEILGRISPSDLAAVSSERLELEKKSLLVRLLEGQVQTKLVYQDAKRTIPAERFPEIERKIADFFTKEELPKRMEKAGVATAAEYDEKLRAMGSSLERTKRTFVEQAMAAEWVRGQRGDEPKISHNEMLDYYRQHQADYETPARARWERMTVRIPRYSDGREAHARLAQMGNEVLRGRSMAEVLAAQPHDGLECRGGVQGWVTQGDGTVSNTIEQGIFELPTGRLSRIFRDGDAFHIIRVLEREPFQRKPFDDPEVQSEIREQLRDQRRAEQTEKYLARLRQQFPVWTVFDDDPELAELRRQSDPSRR